MSLSARYLSPFWWKETLRARAVTLVNSVGFRPHVIRKRIEGEDCAFFIGDPTGAAWYGRTLDHDNLEMRFVREHLLKPGMTVLEVGGHHGHDTIPLSRWAGEAGRVITVEPLPETVAIIRENVRLNDLRNVEIVAAALGAESGAARLKRTSNGSIATGDSGAPVDVLTVDDLCERRGVWPDLIKLDVEGFEVDVLLGAKKALARRPVLQVEIHPHALPKFGRTAQDFWNALDLTGYECWMQLNDLDVPQPAVVPAPTPNRCHLFARPKV